MTQEKKDNALKIVGSKEHHDKELQIAKKSITLVKGKDYLPINKEENEEIELVDFNQFGNISYACQAYAKSLYYVENDECWQCPC